MPPLLQSKEEFQADGERSLARDKIVSRVAIPQTFYGLCFSADGQMLFSSGAELEVIHAYQFEEGFLFRHKTIAVAEQSAKFIPGGLAVDASGKMLFAAGTWGSAVCAVPPFHVSCAVIVAGKATLLSVCNSTATMGRTSTRPEEYDSDGLLPTAVPGL